MKLCILWMLFPARDGPMICTYLYMFCSSIQTGNPTISLESVRGPGDQKNKNKIRGTSPPWTHPPVIDALTNNHLFISFLTPKPPRLAFSKWAKECGCWNVFFLSINYGHSLQRNATASWCWQKLWNLGDAHISRDGMIFQEIPLFAFSHEKTHFKIHRVSSSISCWKTHLMAMLLKLADITLGISPVWSFLSEIMAAPLAEIPPGPRWNNMNNKRSIRTNGSKMQLHHL